MSNVRLKNPYPWINLASQNGWAFASICFIDKSESDTNWDVAELGSGKALIKAFDTLAEKDNIPPLSNRPLLIAGVCQAGQFAYNLAAFNPQRVAAFVTIGGGKHDASLAKNASRVPGLLVAATDRGDAADNMKALFLRGRELGAEWSLASEPVAAYDRGTCSQRVLDFLQDMMKRANSGSRPDIRKVKGDSTHQLSSDNKLHPNLCKECWSSRGNPFDLLTAEELSNVSRTKPSTRDNGPFSFCSSVQPLPVRISPQYLDLGLITLESRKQIIHVVFNVQRLYGDVDSVTIPDNANHIHCIVHPLAKAFWNVDCEVTPELLGYGSFRIKLPICLKSKGERIPCGANVILRGTVIGDITSQPNNIYLPTLTAGQELVYRLNIISKTGSPFSVMECKSDQPEWTSVLLERTSADNATIRCVFKPPTKLRGQAFSGFFHFTFRSKQESSINVLYWGHVNE